MNIEFIPKHILSVPYQNNTWEHRTLRAQARARVFFLWNTKDVFGYEFDIHATEFNPIPGEPWDHIFELEFIIYQYYHAQSFTLRCFFSGLYPRHMNFSLVVVCQTTVSLCPMTVSSVCGETTQPRTWEAREHISCCLFTTKRKPNTL
jgi:hypothetical protein